MIGMPFNLQAKGLLEVLEAAGGGGVASGFWVGGGVEKANERLEPTSVLDNRRSPSSPTSSSTLSSSLNGGGTSSDTTAGVAAISDSHAHKWPNPSGDSTPAAAAWAPELRPIPPALDAGADKCGGGGGGDDWESMLSAQAASPTQEQTFLQWIMADPGDDPGDDPAKQQPLSFDDTAGGGGGFGVVDHGFAGMEATGWMAGPAATPFLASAAPGFGHPFKFSGSGAPNNPMFSLAPNVIYPDDKHQHHQQQQLHYGHGGVMLHQHHPQQSPAFYHRHHTAVVEPTCQIPPKSDPFFQQRPAKPHDDVNDSAHQQALVDQLFKAAELIEAGNPVSARGILARLNHHLPSPAGKPLLRSAFYFKDALQAMASAAPSRHFPAPPSSPVDVVLKLGTYKAFSDVSPVLQFTNFTSIQAMLEELAPSDSIHIVDFDIGVGGQWSSFMQELAQRRPSSPAPSLKITAFASPYSHHPLELHLTRENLSNFAADLNIQFEFNVLSLDTFDPAVFISLCSGGDDAIAVNLPASSAYQPSVLRLVKQLSPKIVVSVDHGCDRNDLPFSHQFLHAFQSCTVLLNSIDAAGTNADVSSKIERFLLQPRIETALLGRHRAAADKMLPWRTLFASSGFVPVQFSNFTETQAECLLTRVQVRGFHVEKRQGSLFLCWQRGELVSVSAWKC